MTAETIHSHQKTPNTKKRQRIDSFLLKHLQTVCFDIKVYLQTPCFVVCGLLKVSCKIRNVCTRVFRASSSALKPLWPRWHVVTWRCRYNQYNQDLMKNVTSGNLNPREHFFFLRVNFLHHLPMISNLYVLLIKKKTLYFDSLFHHQIF